jgi:hypothetical protein
MLFSRGGGLVFILLGGHTSLLILLMLPTLLRNFAATQTKNVSCAIYRRYSTKREADEAYEEAQADGFVETL